MVQTLKRHRWLHCQMTTDLSGSDSTLSSRDEGKIDDLMQNTDWCGHVQAAYDAGKPEGEAKADAEIAQCASAVNGCWLPYLLARRLCAAVDLNVSRG